MSSNRIPFGHGHLEALENYLSSIVQRNIPEACVLVLLLLHEVLIEFYTKQQLRASSEKESIDAQDELEVASKKLFEVKTDNLNRYHTIQQGIKLLKRLEKQNKEDFDRALAQAFENRFGWCLQVASSPETTETSNPAYTMLDCLSDRLSNVFFGGIIEKLESVYNPYTPAPTASTTLSVSTSLSLPAAQATSSAYAKNLSDFVTHAMSAIQMLASGTAKEEKRKSKHSKKPPTGFTEKTKAFKSAVNEAIQLLESRKARDARLRSIKGKSRDTSGDDASGRLVTLSTEQQCIAVVETIQGEFNLYVWNTLRRFNDKLAITPTADNLYSFAIDECERIIDSQDNSIRSNIKGALSAVSPDSLADMFTQDESWKIRDAKELLQSILQFNQPGAANSRFGIVNPAFQLMPASLESNMQHKDLLTHCSKRFQKQFNPNTKMGIVERSIRKLDRYLAYCNRLDNRFFDWLFSPVNGLHPTSRKQKIYATENLIAYLKTLNHKELNLEEMNHKEMRQPSDLVSLLSACNLSVYHERLTRMNYIDRASTAKNRITGREIPQVDSEYKKAMIGVIRKVKEYLNVDEKLTKQMKLNQGEFNCLLTTDKQTSAQDIYFELNLSTNFTTQERALKKYTDAVNSFPRSLVARVFSDSSIQNKRIDKLNALMNTLTQCKTPEQYAWFFMDALNILSEVSSPSNPHHLWDGLFRDTITDAMKEVLENHVVTNDTFRLQFSTEQLHLIERAFKAAHLKDSPAYEKLTALIISREAAEALAPEEARAKNEADIPLTAPTAAATRDAQKTANIKAFKDALLQEMESNVLADIVISSDRFQLKPRDFGLLAGHLQMVLSNIPVPAAGQIAGGALAHQLTDMDMRHQLRDGKTIAAQTANAGGFQLWWNEVALTCVNELCAMFEEQLGNMYSDRDAKKFAHFCFKRIYEALKHGIKDVSINTSIPEYLVTAVFLNGTDPLFRHHYRCDGDASWFPKTTFEGLLENVAFVCKEKSADVSVSPLTPPVAVVGGIEAIEQAPANPAPAGTEKSVKVPYLTPPSIVVNNDTSKLVKYGCCPATQRLAQAAGRFRLFRDADMLRLDNRPAEVLKDNITVGNQKQPQLTWLDAQCQKRA